MPSCESMVNVERPPRIRIAPSYAINDGVDAVELAAAYGLQMDDWQTDVLMSWLGRDEADRYTAKTCGLIVPRQNGKNACIEVRELFGMVVLGERILHTAHEVKTSMKAFNRLKSFFGDKANDPAAPYPELNALVKKISNVNGQEAIYLHNGGSVEFSSRSRGAARGFTVDVTIYDEAQELTDEQVNASMPAKSAAPSKNPQTIYTGTPPNYRTNAEVFGRVRENAQKGAQRTSWHEWSVEEIGDVSDRERWYATNPAMPERISEETVEDELNNMSPDGFAMERLAWWPMQAFDTVIDLNAWNKCKVDASPSDGIIVYGVKFAPDGSRGCIAVCCKPKEGLPHIEVVKDWTLSDGLQRFVDFLYERKDKAAQIVIDGPSNSQTLIEQLLAAGLPPRQIERPNSRDVIAANAALLSAINEGSVTHFGQEALDVSATQSAKRKIGQDGGWGFKSTDKADAGLIEACAIAYRSAMNTKRDPNRKMRIG